MIFGGALGDRAFENVALLVVIFIAAICGLCWFSLHSGYSKMVRGLVPFSVVVAIVIASLTLRIEKLSGTLVPKFVPRWSKSPDQLLDDPMQVDSAVDLKRTTPHDFPQFLGPQRDQQVRGIDLATDWTVRPPRILWKQKIGAGWSGFAAVNGFAVTLEQRGDSELTTCYRIETGEVVWWHAEPGRFYESRGGVGPRSTPTIHGGQVYVVGAHGTLTCLSGSGGDVIWKRNILQDVNTTSQRDQEVIAWGRSNSPLIVDDKVIVPGGGPPGGPYDSLLAYDAQTGDLSWRGGDQQISYSSPQLCELDGERQILIVNESTLTSHHVGQGDVLWEMEWDGSSANNASVSQAVPLSGDRVFVSKGYFGGAKVIRVTQSAGQNWTVEDLWHEPQLLKTKFTNVCIAGHHVYGLSDGILECVDVNSGERCWKRGRFGHGQILLVKDVLLVQSETGALTMVSADPERFVVMGKTDVLVGQAWNHLCMFGNHLLMRSDEEAACLELPQKSTEF